MITIKTKPWYLKMIHQGDLITVHEMFGRYNTSCANRDDCIYKYNSSM